MKCTSLFRKTSRKALALAMAAVATVALQHGSAFAQSSKLQQTGTITINQTQVAFIFSGNVGGGTLQFQGKSYPFTIGGLGVGGVGVSQIDAVGEVYEFETAQ